MESIAKLIGERIRIYRNRRGWSQAELAEMANCHYTFIGSVERGEKVPSVDTIYKICLALDLPMEVLFEKIVSGENPSETSKKIYDIVNALPEGEQKEIYDLLLGIIKYADNKK